MPTYEPFKLPENVSLEKEPMDAFTKILGEIETGKLDHTGMQNAGQKLIDLAAKIRSIRLIGSMIIMLAFTRTRKKNGLSLLKKTLIWAAIS